MLSLFPRSLLGGFTARERLRAGTQQRNPRIRWMLQGPAVEAPFQVLQVHI